MRIYPNKYKAFKMYVVGMKNIAPTYAYVAKHIGLEEVPLKHSEIGGWMKRNMSQKVFFLMRLGFPYAKKLLENEAICLIDDFFVECSHDDGCR